MGRLTAGLHRASSTLSWVQAHLPKPPQLYADRFAHPHEVHPLVSQHWQQETGLLVGVSAFKQVLSVRRTPQRRELGNVLVDALTRGGKGLLAISQLLTWPHSAVVLDIKGELYEATAAYRKTLGNVFVIDPEAVGHQFDPLHGRSTERQLYAAAKYLLYEAGERDPIFIQRGIKMVTQLFLAGREENRKMGYEKYHLLPYAGQLMHLPINQVAAHVHAVSPELATKFLSAVYKPEKDYEEKKFLTSSWETATSRLYPILSDELLRCFDGSDFTASDLITSPTPITVYLRLPEAELLALTPVVRLIFQTLIHDLQTTYDKRAGRTATEKGCYPVLLLLDEAGRVGIPMLYEYATTVVGRQISLWVAIQSIKQLDAMYGPANAETLLDNMDTQLFYRQRRATAKYLEEELGRKSEYSHSQSTREGGHETQGLSEQGVPLMTANQIKQMEDWDIIVFHHNLPPFRARRMNWMEHPILRAREAKQPPKLSPLPPLTPLELRSPVSPDDTDDTLMNPGDFETLPKHLPVEL
jgi:type IV secretion system protein VirD4